MSPMEWVLWIFVAVMLGLFVWSIGTAGRVINRNIQPFIDDLFGVEPSKRDDSRKPPQTKAD